MSNSNMRRSPQPYFIYAGWLVAVVVAITALNRLQYGAQGWSFKVQLGAVGVVTCCFVGMAFARANRTVFRFLARSRPERPPLTWSLRRKIVAGGAISFFDRSRTAKMSESTLTSSDDAKMPMLARLNNWLAGDDSGSPISLRRWMPRTVFIAFGVFACVLVVATLLSADHRRFVLLIAALEVSAVYALRPSLARQFFIPLIVLATFSWALTSGIPYTHLGDWLLNGAPWTDFAIAAFVCGFGIVLAELTSDEPHAPDRRSTLIFFAIGLAVFAAFALRTDSLTANWVPWHRSYFADVAQSVRTGHWLLYDVPSLYGFLSILFLAVVPAPNGWQALYEVTALFLTAQACITFAILRWGRSGALNGVFAILFPLTTLLAQNLSRYDLGARLYPQGGMRFIWVDCLLFAAFLTYVWRDHPARSRIAMWAGHIAWTIALFWSPENTIWTLGIWVPFVLTHTLVNLRSQAGVLAAVVRLCSRIWPLIVLPSVTFTAVVLYYYIRIGVPPDWLAYVEYVAGFVAPGGLLKILYPQYFGAGWAIVLVLAAVGASAIAVIRSRRWALLPLITATWLAVWLTATYYAVEPLEMYAVLLLAVLGPATAVVIFVSRQGFDDDATPYFARLSLAPLAIVAIAYAFGSPSQLAAMRFPFVHSQTFDTTALMPTISGELAELMRRAGVHPDDKVLIPTGPYWSQISQGLILPFTRLPNGKVVEYQAWLPSSPVGPTMLWTALPASRREAYAERFLRNATSAGWYIAYRAPADCTALSPRLATAKTYRSPNFVASLCTLLPR